MAKKIIRLTESDLHRVIKESVTRIINEISTDTVDWAKDGAYKKLSTLARKHGNADERTKRAADQYAHFRGEYDKRYKEGNAAKQAKMVQRQEDRENGKRKYYKGVGWRDADKYEKKDNDND